MRLLNSLATYLELNNTQRRRRRSGWSCLGRTTFQRIVGLVCRLQRQSEDETIGPGVPRKLAFALCVRVSRNRSRSFAGGSGAQRGLTGLHRHPRVAKCTYDVQLLAMWRNPLLAVVLLLSLAQCRTHTSLCTCTSDILFQMA